jgi:hypothetical protein
MGNDLCPVSRAEGQVELSSSVSAIASLAAAGTLATPSETPAIPPRTCGGRGGHKKQQMAPYGPASSGGCAQMQLRGYHLGAAAAFEIRKNADAASVMVFRFGLFSFTHPIP